jgi:hypothetical protein
MAQDTVHFEAIPHRDFVLVFEEGVLPPVIIAVVLALTAAVVLVWRRRRRRSHP